MREPADDASSTAWLARVRALQAIAQEGLSYADNPFDAARYARLKQVTADIAGALDAEGPPGPLRLAVEQADGYLTPKLDVRAAVFDDDGRVLLVRELRDRRWSLPGGWADVGEGIAVGAVREVREESGYVVEVRAILRAVRPGALGTPADTAVHPQGRGRVPARRRDGDDERGDRGRGLVRPRRGPGAVARAYLGAAPRPRVRAPRRPDAASRRRLISRNPPARSPRHRRMGFDTSGGRLTLSCPLCENTTFQREESRQDGRLGPELAPDDVDGVPALPVRPALLRRAFGLRPRLIT